MATTEERLAALEAKLAALTATTPTEYYTHQYSGEEIDDAVSRALPNGAIDQAVGTFTRPNLLDNWYFGRPVNQRGQTEYTGNMAFIIDRWRMRGTTATVTLEDDGLVINCDGGSFNSIVQSYGVPAQLLGKKVTLSVLVTENTNNTESFIEIGSGSNSAAAGTVLGGNLKFTGTGLFSLTMDLPATMPNNYLNFIICAGNPTTAGARFKAVAAKLELGSTQTLAHREGDKWVLNEVPDYGEQLRRCQRYCRVIGGTLNEPICIAIRRESTMLEGCILFDFPMRTAPSVSITGTFSTIPEFLGIEFTSQDSISPEGVSLFFKKQNGAPFAGTAYLIYAPSDTRITFSADL